MIAVQNLTYSFLVCGAAVSIKPGVKRSGTPGLSVEKARARDAGDSITSRKGYRPLRGLGLSLGHLPGVPLRFTPGFMLSPAPQAGTHYS
jgi:hypothetical protein